MNLEEILEWWKQNPDAVIVSAEQEAVDYALEHGLPAFFSPYPKPGTVLLVKANGGKPDPRLPFLKMEVKEDSREFWQRIFPQRYRETSHPGPE